MKNLRINRQKISALLGTIVLTTNLAACNFTNSNNSKSNNTQIYTQEDNVLNKEGLEYVVVNNKLIAVSDLALMDKNGNIVESVDNVVVNNKLMKIENPVNIKFDSNIESVVVGNELVSPSEFKLVNANTKEEITSIDSFVLNGELVDASSLLSLNGSSNNEILVDENYEELTDEKFYELCDAVYSEYKAQGLAVEKTDVIKYVMMVNIDKLAEDNPNLIDTIVGKQEPDEVVLDIFKVLSSLMTENNSRYCARGLGWDSLFMASTPIFDKAEKNRVLEIEERIKEIVSVSGDKTEFNKLVNDLLMDMIDAKEECFNLEDGTGYNVVNILFNFIRINFSNLLDKQNSELIKYMIVYAGDGVEYEENSRSTAYYRGVYNILTDCKEDVKTLTK